MAEGFAGHTPGEPFGDVRAGREREVHGRIGFDQPDLPAEEWRERYYRADQRANAALDKYDSLRSQIEAEVETSKSKIAACSEGGFPFTPEPSVLARLQAILDSTSTEGEGR